MSPSDDSLLKKRPSVQKNVDLTELNTMGVNATAKRFVEVTHPNQLKLLFDEGFFDGEEPVILGGGSNLLFVEEPDRPVLKVSISGIKIDAQKDHNVIITAGAGETWHDLVAYAVENGLGGIENLALIPGTTGAAPIQNIGAYGVELQDVFESLTAFDLTSGTFKTFESKECRFGYRDSIFKRELRGKVVICDVSMRLTRSDHQLNVSYSGLRKHLERKGIGTPSIRDIFDAVIEIRRSKLPDPASIGNAGSFFKNPVVNEEEYVRLKSENPDIPSYKLAIDEYKIPAAWLIEQAGWKGKKVGNVGTYENQALVLVNHGGASGREIYNHALKIRASVLQQFGIDLHPEVNILGTDS